MLLLYGQGMSTTKATLEDRLHDDVRKIEIVAPTRPRR